MPLTGLKPLDLPDLPAAPRVSIAITCYNYGRFLRECLDGCLAQTVPAAEIVVVDDGSSDDSKAILDAYASQFPSIRAITRVNGGMCAATNTALDACTGDVVLLLDADDLIGPQRIEKVLEALRTKVDGRLPGWVHHQLRQFSAEQADAGLTPYYATGQAPEGLDAENVLQSTGSKVVTMTSGLAFRSELLAAIGPLDERRVTAQDHMLRTAASLISPVAFVAEPLGGYRLHGASDSSGGLMSSPAKIKLVRERSECFDDWIRAFLEKTQPGASSLWRPLAEQPSYWWYQFLDRWWSGRGKDHKLLWRILRQPNPGGSSLQSRLYIYGSVILPKDLYIAYSQLIFGNNPVKTFLKRLLGRR